MSNQLAILLGSIIIAGNPTVWRLDVRTGDVETIACEATAGTATWRMQRESRSAAVLEEVSQMIAACTDKLE
jgi:hypothetical protein